jgi:hypothetical protein
MTGTELVPSDVDARTAEIERQVAEARGKAEAIEVRTPEEAERAGRLLREIAGQKRRVEDDRKKLKEPVLEAGRRIDKQAKDATASLDAVDAIIRPKLGFYTAEQERIRAEEEARLEAERQAREKTAREARENQEAEERAKREQAEREAREAEKLAAEAKDAEEAEAAQALAEEARIAAEEAATAEAAIASLPEVQLPKATVAAPAKPDGISDRTKREAFVVDRAKLPVTLPDGTPLIVVDMVALRRWMNEQWTATDEPPELPGAEFKRVPDGLTVRG